MQTRVDYWSDKVRTTMENETEEADSVFENDNKVWLDFNLGMRRVDPADGRGPQWM